MSSSLDMSVEDHDEWDESQWGIPERCFCFPQPVLEMNRTGQYAGRMMYRCSHRGHTEGTGHLSKWFDVAVHEEFRKMRRDIQQLCRMTESQQFNANRMAELETANKALKEQLTRDRKQIGVVLLCMGARFFSDGGVHNP